MKITHKKDEQELIGSLVKAYKAHRGDRTHSANAKLIQLEITSKRLMHHLTALYDQHGKEIIAVVEKDSLVLYKKEENGTFSPVNYCEK